jgi:hypothetical protein
VSNNPSAVLQTYPTLEAVTAVILRMAEPLHVTFLYRLAYRERTSVNVVELERFEMDELNLASAEFIHNNP